jgi:hypothetical protein
MTESSCIWRPLQERLVGAVYESDVVKRQELLDASRDPIRTAARILTRDTSAGRPRKKWQQIGKNGTVRPAFLACVQLRND